MKYILLSLLSLFLLTLQAQTTKTVNKSVVSTTREIGSDPSANQTLPVNISAASITMDTQPGQLSVMIPQVTLKEIQKDWQHYAANGSKGKATIADGQYTQIGAVNTNISPDPFNITAKMLATTEGVRVNVWLSDNNNFQNSKGSAQDRDLALQKYMRDFAVMEYRQSVTNEMKAEQEKEKALENDMTKLIKEEERANKNSEDDRRAIQKSTDAIATSKNDIAATSVKIEAQKGMVSNVAADANASKGAKKTLHDLEEAKIKLQKQNDRESKNIEAKENDIKANDRTVLDIQGKKTLKRDAIEKQKQVVESVKAKLEGIK